MREQPLLLMVDDEPSVLQALRRVFRKEPYQIHTAESAIEALALFESGAPVRAVVSDYRMPEMTGVEFLKKVYECSPETVRIVLSGYADRPVLLAAVQEGRIYKYLPKPWDDDLLRNTVRRGIEQTALAWQRREQIQTLAAENTDLLQRASESIGGVADCNDFVERMARMMAASRHLSDNQTPGIIGIGSNEVILVCNDPAAGWLQSTPRDLIGARISEVFTEGLCSFIRELLATDRAGTLYYHEGDLNMRGMRLSFPDNDYAAIIFI